LLFKHRAHTHRKAKPSRGLLARPFRRAPKHSLALGALPPLPAGSMPQRPPMPPRTAHSRVPSSPELIEAANRLTGSFSGHFRLDGNVPLFRDDETTWAQFEDSRLERLRRMQDLTKAKMWPDAHGVNLGEHGPKTLVFSTTDYPRFSDGTGTIPAVKR